MPLSPVRKTEASVRATLAASSMTSRMILEAPRMGRPPTWGAFLAAAFGSGDPGRLSLATVTAWAARPMRTWSCAAEKGLGR